MENFNCIRQEANIEQIKKCRWAIAENTTSIENLSEQFSLAGNAVRLKILYLLHHEKKLCVCDLSDILQNEYYGSQSVDIFVQKQNL